MTSTRHDLALPDLGAIRNEPHRFHHSYAGPSGERLPDTRPDATFRTAGLEDAALYSSVRVATRTEFDRTVNACHTHGPDSQVDRFYLTPELLPTIAGFEVIEVNEDLSDHHILRLPLDGNRLSDVLHHTVSA